MAHRESKDPSTPKIAQNLRRIVATMPTISAAAQRMGINRQQLNKYLNGSSQPSLRTMKRIATAFTLPLDSLSWPEEILQSHLTTDAPLLQENVLGYITEAVRDVTQNSANRLVPYCGLYLHYLPLPVLNGKVLVSLASVQKVDQILTVQIAKRYSPIGHRTARKEVLRKTYVMTVVQDRIQMISFGEKEEDGAPSFSIFYPIYTSGVQYLSGLSVGCAGYGQNLIYTSNVVMKKIRSSRLTHNLLRATGVSSLEDNVIDSEVRFRLCQGSGNIPFTHCRE